MVRIDGRLNDTMRTVKITPDYLKYAEGSCLIELGQTKVICTASIDTKVPPHLKDTGTGWITAEYAMLPRATGTRSPRERNKLSGRTFEIQRLIGRALRAAVDLQKLGERTIVVDCDVIQADGGTRVASITGAYVAVVKALRFMKSRQQLKEIPLKNQVAAVSVGSVHNAMLLDLCYEEDSVADVDFNIVATATGHFIEVQGTGENGTFSKEQLDKLLLLGQKGLAELIQIQQETLNKK